MAPLAEAFVRVRARTDGVRRDVNREFGGAGREAGDTFTRGFLGSGLLRSAGRALSRSLGGGSDWSGAGGNAGRQFGAGFTRDASGILRDSLGRYVSESAARGRESGQQFGQQFGAGFTRDARGRLHDALGRYVSESGASGRESGQQFSTGFTSAASAIPPININAGPALAAIQQLGIGLLSLAAIPVGATAIVGLTGLAGAAAAAGVGVLGLQAVAVPAFGRIAEAIAQEKAAQLQSGQAAVQSQGRALALAGAQQALASAVRNAGFAHKQALEGVRTAEISLSQAQRSAIGAQLDLTRARQEAARALQDQQNQLISGRLAIRQDELAVDRARIALQKLTSARQDDASVAQAQAGLADAEAAARKVLADPAAADAAKEAAKQAVSSAQQAVKSAQTQRTEHTLERKEAQLQYEQAIQQLREQQLAQKRLEADSRKAAKAGVSGSEQVRAAREALRSANLQVASSERALSQARANVARTDAQSADAVTSARRALTQASLQGAAGNAALAAAMADLSPAERKLKADWEDLTATFDKWQRSMEPTVLPLFSKGIGILKSQLPSLTPFVEGAASGFDKLLDRVSKGAKGKEFAGFKKQLAALSGPATESLGNSTINVAVGIGRIFQAFLPYAPVALAYLEKFTAKFAEWSKTNFSGGGSEGFKNFIEYAKTSGPQVLSTLKEVSAAIQHLVVALAPLAGTAGLGALSTIRLFAIAVQGLSPGQIQAIAVALVAVKVAMLGIAAARTASTAISGTVGALRTGAGAAAGFVGGFRNVNRAFEDGASRSTTLGAALRSQLQRWRQQASAARASAAATLSTARANARAKAAAAGNWLKTQASSFRAAAAAKLADARAAATNAAANLRAKAAAAGNWLSVQAAALRAAAAAHLANARAATAGAIANLRQRAAAIASAVAAGVVKVATVTWTAVQWLLNTALSANPIGLVVLAVAGLIAAFVLAYNKIGWFRTGVQAVFSWLQTAVSFVVNFVKSHWRLLLPILLGPFGIAIALITKYWSQIKGAVVVAATFVINWVKSHWRLLLSILGGPIGLAVALVTKHWSKIKSITTGMINAVQSGIHRGMTAVRNSFSNAVTAIGRTWDRIRGVTKAPVNFVINTVYNKGIRGLWNTVTGWLHLKGLQLGKIPALAAGGTLNNPQRVGAGGKYSKATAIVGEGDTTHPEFVIPTDPAHRSRAQALWAAAGSKLQMLEGGGLLGSVWKGIKKGASKVTDIGKMGLALLDDPKKLFDQTAAKMVPGAQHLATSPWGTAIAAVPKRLLGAAWEAAKGMIDAFKKGFGGGGGAQGVVKAARTQIGVPYVWGGTNWNHGLDCSGLTQGAWSHGAKKQITRTTYTQRKFLKTIPGPRPGAVGQPHSGHTYMASRVQGGKTWVVEAQRTGTRISEHPLTRSTPWWGWPPGMASGGALVKGLGEQFLKGRNPAAKWLGLAGDPGGVVRGYGPQLRPLTFDSGGLLPPGMFNRTGRPERVTTDEQWSALIRLAQRGAEPQRPIEVHNHALPGIPSDQQITSSLDKALIMHGGGW
ncbi:NlpC/P60 family protein [Actinomadura sp. GTD37]|uniref:NlpC/P60 family protein n=1 Tax=Actinomadura sp. GTD37 TaxID=1778030 RepID=UPI0035C1E179